MLRVAALIRYKCTPPGKAGCISTNWNLLIYNLSMNANSTLIRTFSIKYFCTTFSIIK